MTASDVGSRGMWRTLALVALIVGFRLAAADEGLLGHWACDGEGVALLDTSPSGIDGELFNTARARGAFGRALLFDAKGQSVVIPGPAGLDGSDEMTVQAWVLWEGTDCYPNILTGGIWSPGGFLIFVRDGLCSFRMGKRGHKSGRPGDKWGEVSATFLNKLPLRKWVHLAAVFKRPNITTYVNGVKTGGAAWNYPVGFSGDIVLGRWNGGVSHRGLIDEVKLYNRARTREEIAADIAKTSKGRNVAEYKVEKPDWSKVPRVLSLENRLCRMELGERGRILSLYDRVSKRELMALVGPLAMVKVEGRWLNPRGCRVEKDRVLLDFGRNTATVELKLSKKKDYFRIEVVKVTPEDAEGIRLLRFAPSCFDRVGQMSGMCSDDVSGVCVRALNLQTNVSAPRTGGLYNAVATDEYGLVGASLALVVGPYDRMKKALQNVTRQEDVPLSMQGGAFSMDADENRGSYLFAGVTESNVGQWIETARRGGFTTVHFSSGWHKSLGHYKINTDRFPDGMASLKRAIDRIHEAGLKAGMHTLSGCIQTNDSWVTPVPDPRMKADASYTLAKPLSPTDDTIFVNERPGAHDVVWTYSGNGNALRVGKEMVRYGAISHEKPYAFLKCERGAFKTKPLAHEAGSAADHLLQRYLAFYPDESTDLAQELAACIGKAYNTCGFDQIYQDGAEGMRGWHPIAIIRTAIYEALKRPTLVEASCHGHHNWWFHSRLGAWDHPKWAPKRFHDMHIAHAERFRAKDLIEPQLGWWALVGTSRVSRGMYPDEVEYFVTKNLSINGAMSIQGVQVGATPPNRRQEEYFTLIGWYEKLRLANWFAPETVQALRPDGVEFRLRQNDEGLWRFRPLHVAKHRITAVGNGSEHWQTKNPHGAQKLRVRVEALHSVEPYDSPQGILIDDFSDLKVFSIRRQASNVTQSVSVTTEDVKAGGRSLVLRAHNRSEQRTGAWTQFGRIFGPYRNIRPAQALGFWVKGDGKGEVLNLQLTNPREHTHCYAEHYVVIDFTGWRYVEFPFRDRSSDQYHDYKWPYYSQHGIFRNVLKTGVVNSFSLYLNNLPPGEKVEVLLSPVKGLAIRGATLATPTLTVGGQTVELPLPIRSGQYIEIDEEKWGTLYSARGESLRRFALPAHWPTVAGNSAVELQFACTPPLGHNARAEVTVFTLGNPFGERASKRNIKQEYVQREYDLPRLVTTDDGPWNSWTLPCRPDGKANLEFEIAPIGIIADPAAHAAGGTLMEAGTNASLYTLSRSNRYSKYAYDSSGTKDVPAKPGVTLDLALSKDAKVGASCLLFTAASTRKDRRGWAAKGRRFSPPIDISGSRALGFWLHGDGKGESFKLQLRDSKGLWHDMVTRVDFSGWRYIEFDILQTKANLKSIEYIILFFNGIPGGARVACRFDELKALVQTSAISVPTLKINDQTIDLDFQLETGRRVVYRGGDTVLLLNRNGTVVAEKPIGDKPPKLRKGVNTVSARFPESAPDSARAVVRMIKVY